MAAEEWRKTILAEMGRALKPFGFKRDGLTFRKQIDAGYEVISLQSSQWGTSSDLRVCVNFGVFYHAIWERKALGALPKNGPATHNCHWQSRLGSGAGSGDGPTTWLNVRSDADAIEAALRITVGLAEDAFPRLDALDTLDKLWAGFQATLAAGGGVVLCGGRVGMTHILQSIYTGEPPEHFIPKFD